MKNLLCILGFHSKGETYKNQYSVQPYNTVDGINRVHITVAKNCDRCNEAFDHKHVCLTPSIVNLCHSVVEGAYEK